MEELARLTRGTEWTGCRLSHCGFEPPDLDHIPRPGGHLVSVALPCSRPSGPIRSLLISFCYFYFVIHSFPLVAIAPEESKIDTVECLLRRAEIDELHAKFRCSRTSLMLAGPIVERPMQNE